MESHASAECDPRWDIDGFNATCDDLSTAWAKVGWLRRLWKDGGSFSFRRFCPVEALHIGAPPADAQLYVVNQRWLSHDTGDTGGPDPEGFHLDRLIAALDADGAFDDDLVWIDALANFVEWRTEEERQLFQKQVSSSQFMYHFRLKHVILPDVPEGSGLGDYFTSMWALHSFSVCTFACSRIVTQPYPKLRPSKDEEQHQVTLHEYVKQHMTPEWLMNTESQISLTRTHIQGEESLIREQRHVLGNLLVPAVQDAVGFQTICEHANFRWVFVSFIHQLAERGGPAPRCQDLPPGAYVDGMVPHGSQPWVTTYPWAATNHFSPSGAKLRELAAVLRELKAESRDVVFLDFLSLLQKQRTVPKLYAEQNMLPIKARHGKVELPGLNAAEKQMQKLALYETTRLYAFAGGRLPDGTLVKGCKVVVLPALESPHDFPDGGKITLETNHEPSPARDELNSEWGFAKSVPYLNGGWTCAEYAVARKNRTICNAHHQAVRDVERGRSWPKDVRQFAAMMDENSKEPVIFTNKGDREAVRFNFYRFCYRFNHVE